MHNTNITTKESTNKEPMQKVRAYFEQLLKGIFILKEELFNDAIFSIIKWRDGKLFSEGPDPYKYGKFPNYGGYQLAKIKHSRSAQKSRRIWFPYINLIEFLYWRNTSLVFNHEFK